MNTRSQNSMAVTPVPAQGLSFGENVSTPTVYRWQYNGRAPWDDIIDWCQKNLYHGGYYEPKWYTHNGYETIYFKDPREYTLFLLRWS